MRIKLMCCSIISIVLFVASASMAQMSVASDLNTRQRSGTSQLSTTGADSVGPSIYSADRVDKSNQLGVPPTSPSAASSAQTNQQKIEALKKANEANEGKPVEKVPIPSPPGGATKGVPAGQKQQRQEPSEGISLDAFRPHKANTFDQVTQAVQESIKVHMVIPPEMPTTVRMSNRDINRITCQEGLIKDVVYSKEKGLMINFTGKDAFLKYRIIRSGSKMQYVTGPTELYISCNDQIYTLIAVPEGIPAQIVKLSSGAKEKIKTNQSVYGGMALEKKVMALIKATYTDSIPDSFSIRKVGKKYDLFKDVNVTLERIVGMDGEGIQVKELKLTLSEKSPLDKVKISEKDFLDIELTKNTMGIAVDNANLTKGKTIRVFICEQSNSEVGVEVKSDRK